VSQECIEYLIAAVAEADVHRSSSKSEEIKSQRRHASFATLE
jgi:hypothetical protein